MHSLNVDAEVFIGSSPEVLIFIINVFFVLLMSINKFVHSLQPKCSGCLLLKKKKMI